jgi:hypothetical protein
MGNLVRSSQSPYTSHQFVHVPACTAGTLQRQIERAERRGRVFNTAASYSGGPGSNLGTETGYHKGGFRGFALPLQANAGIAN